MSDMPKSTSAAGDAKIGIIGLGFFSQFHVAAWRQIEAANLVAICDTNPEALARADVAPSTSRHLDLGEMLAAHDLDIIDLVVPPAAQAALIDQVARPGRTIICQKPFCRDLAEAEKVVELAKDVGARVLIHENFRFQPWYREIKQRLTNGELGKVYQCQFYLRPGDGRGADAYLSRQPSFQKMPRFLIHETGVHFIDVFKWLFGDVTAVYADLRQLNPAISGEDAGHFILEHQNGTRSIFDGNRLSDHVAENPRTTMGEMVIEGEKGTLTLNGNGELSFRAFGKTTPSHWPLSVPADFASFGGGCVEALNRHVINALDSGEPENLAKDYLTIIKIEETIYRSAKEGRRIDILQT